MFKSDDRYQKDISCEGGGLNKDALAAFNKETGINNSGMMMSKEDDEISDKTHIEGLEEFNKYGDLFQDLTKRHIIETDHMDVIEMAISYDSKYCLCIVRKSDDEVQLIEFDLITYDRIFDVSFAGEYIKLNIIEQNEKGDLFAIAYQDNGQFFVRVLDNTGAQKCELDVSNIVKLDTESKPISGQEEPMITCAFIPNEDLFISVYHRRLKKQIHFTYSWKQNKVLSELVGTIMTNSSGRNFPIKSFYSTVTKNCHTFYRQGHGFTCEAADPENCWTEKVTDKDMGQMYLLFDQALVTRSSGSILFFKIDEETGEWTEYECFDDMRGQIFFIRGNVRIQVTTDQKIYFFMINKKTLQPTLENVMYNFMECSQLMFGSRVRFGISFKFGQPNF